MKTKLIDLLLEGVFIGFWEGLGLGSGVRFRVRLWGRVWGKVWGMVRLTLVKVAHAYVRNSREVCKGNKSGREDMGLFMRL